MKAVRTKRRLVRLSAVGVAAVTAFALAGVLLLPDSGPSDPTRRGPTRHLELTEARIEEDRGQEAKLVVRGRTNLVRGARLQVAILSGPRELLRLQAQADGAGFALEASAAGAILAGSYEVTVSFRLEEQPEPVRGALGYQPARLSARRPLALPLRLTRGVESTDEVRELVRAVNRGPREAAEIDELDRRARALADRLWIGDEKAALARLRQALDEARRPELRRREFDRLLLEAHALAGL